MNSVLFTKKTVQEAKNCKTDKKQHHEVKHSCQICCKYSQTIKASVIINWLKTNNIRQVQYMAGHKSKRSTEQYRNHDLTDLNKQLDLFHSKK